MSILDNIPDEYKPTSEFYDKNKVYSYPFILKPVLCSGISREVSIIKNEDDLKEYFKNNKIEDTMYQEFIDSEYEIGLLYERNPLHKNGKIKSIVLRTFLKHDKIKAAPSIKEYLKSVNNNEFINMSHLITPKLTNKIDSISKRTPNLFVGRYDIRLHNLNDLKEARNFYILELNSVMGYDLMKDLKPFYHPFSLSIKISWLMRRLYYGILNIVRLNCVSPYVIFIKFVNAIKCHDYEKLYE